MKAIFDQLGNNGNVNVAMMAVVALALLGVVREGVNGAANWLSWRTRLRVHDALLEAAVDKLQRLHFDYHRDKGVGGILTRLERGIQGVVGAITELSTGLVPSIAYLLFAVMLMLRMDWRLTLVVLLFAPLPALVASKAAPVQIRRERTLFERWGSIYARFTEALAGLPTVRAFAREGYEKKRFLERVRRTNALVIRGVGFDTSVGALQNIAILLARIAAVGIGAYLVLDGQVTVGTVVAFLGYVQGLFGPIQGLTGMYQNLQKASVATEEVFDIIDAPVHVRDKPDAVHPGRLRGEITFNQVTFAYQDDTEPVLRDISLHIPPGKKVALVGPSGSGKSTLVALLQRFYDPGAGHIGLDGYDLRDLQQIALREQLGVVMQQPLLFNDTVHHNLVYARPTASLAEVRAAAQAAQIDAVIESLPHGYDTVLGEGGSRLSMGQRQRIAIARVLLKDPPIVVLDEATSALDAETTALLQAALDRLLASRTAIIIAHRLSTVVHADHIVVLRSGRIVATGTHAELMHRDGYYAQLVSHQTRGLLPATLSANQAQAEPMRSLAAPSPGNTNGRTQTRSEIQIAPSSQPPNTSLG